MSLDDLARVKQVIVEVARGDVSSAGPPAAAAPARGAGETVGGGPAQAAAAAPAAVAVQAAPASPAAAPALAAPAQPAARAMAAGSPPGAPSEPVWPPANRERDQFGTAGRSSAGADPREAPTWPAPGASSEILADDYDD
ncbi:MAG TPA: hypothetical protein VOA80_10940 [Thermoanaerobaculia bacterium]|nr:hypothetical protein [Thermoanaerobaculia bacterium]